MQLKRGKLKKERQVLNRSTNRPKLKPNFARQNDTDDDDDDDFTRKFIFIFISRINTFSSPLRLSQTDYSFLSLKLLLPKVTISIS